MDDAIGTEAANRFVGTLLDELLSDLDALAGRLRRLSTARLQEVRRAVDAELAARLQEVRRAVDAELAARMQPSEDLRDGKAGRT